VLEEQNQYKFISDIYRYHTYVVLIFKVLLKIREFLTHPLFSPLERVIAYMMAKMIILQEKECHGNNQNGEEV
jgi:hypothetical protein